MHRITRRIQFRGFINGSEDEEGSFIPGGKQEEGCLRTVRLDCADCADCPRCGLTDCPKPATTSAKRECLVDGFARHYSDLLVTPAPINISVN